MFFKKSFAISVCFLLLITTYTKDSNAIYIKSSNHNIHKSDITSVLNDFNYHTGWKVKMDHKKKPWLKVDLKKNQFVYDLAIFPSMLPFDNESKSWSHYQRPKTLTLIFSDNSKKKVILNDLAELQLIPINKNIKTIKVFIGDTYQGESQDLAISQCRAITSKSKDISFDLELDNQNFKKNNVHFYGIFHIKTPLNPLIKNQLPIQTMLCFNQTPSANTQELLNEFLTSLNENDFVGLIQNHKKAKLHTPLKKLDAEHKITLSEEIKNLFPYKIPNIQSSIEKALTQFKKQEQKQETLPILIIMVENNNTVQLSKELLENLLSIPKLSIYIIDKNYTKDLKTLTDLFPGKYFFNVQNEHAILASVFSHIQNSPYHNLTLRLFNPQGFKIHDEASKWQIDNNDYLTRIPSLMPGEQHLMVIPFIYHSTNSLQLEEYNLPSYIQGVFNYQDQYQQMVQQSLLFKVIPQKNETLSLSEKLNSHINLIKKDPLIELLD